MNFKQHRVSNNLTQEQVAQDVGVQRTTVAMWESGKSRPRAELLPKLAKNTEKNLVQQVGDYFRTLGNKVFRRGLGEVVLDERGVKDSMAHGIGRRKAAAFAAVPQVIAQGRQIDTQQNWKGRGYDKQPIAPPVQGPAGRPERKRHGRACCRADEVHDRGVFVQ